MTVRPHVGLSDDPIIRLRQKLVIGLNIELGRTLHVTHPEIAELYRQGHTRSDIADELGVSGVYGVSKNVAISAVGFALRGYEGHLEWVSLDRYNGLLSDEELDRIAIEHNRECGKVIGQEMYEKGIGIHGRSTEERSAAGRKGGRLAFENGLGIFGISPERKREIASKVGQRHYEQGTGFFAMTPEEKAEASRIGGLRNLENGTGIFSMTPEEQSEAGRKGGTSSYYKGAGIHALNSQQKQEVGRRGGLKAKELGLGVHARTEDEQREHGREHGLRAKAEGKGIFALTTEQKRELGRRNYLNGVGIHGRTSEQMSEDGRKAALACGFTLWNNDEVQYVRYLTQQSEYQHKSGRHVGSPDRKLITEKVNEVFHQGKNVRTTGSIKMCLKRYK